MKPKQLTMLTKMLDIIEKHEELSRDDSFLKLLNYVASQLNFSVPVDTGWFKKKTIEQLDDIFDIGVLTASKWDWFGELHAVERLTIIDNELLVPMKDAKSFVTKIKPQALVGRVLNTDTYTGRCVLMNARRGDRCFYYCVEQELVPYRIALLNFKIYDIPATIINADPLVSDIREMSPNWRQANIWVPVEKYMVDEAETNERIRPMREGFYNIV